MLNCVKNHEICLAYRSKVNKKLINQIHNKIQNTTKACKVKQNTTKSKKNNIVIEKGTDFKAPK